MPIMPVGVGMRIAIFGLVFALAAFAAKPVAPAVAEDENLVIEASAFIEKSEVAQALGQDPGMDLIVVEVKLRPRGETKIKLDADDFTLLSRKDGQRSQPMAPSQIAGSGALVVIPGSSGGGGGGVLNQRRAPIWGGAPGTGTRPRRIGGDDEGGAVSGPTQTQASVSEGKTADTPLLEILKAKALPQTETNQPTTGLLYFFLEGKHKLKQLELMYKSPSGKLVLDFER
jgi:hypothetical protein